MARYRKVITNCTIFWLPDAKNWLIWKDPDAGKDWRQKEKGMTEDEMVGWHYQLIGHEFEQHEGLVMDSEAWHAAVHGVAKSWTWLSDWTDWLNCRKFQTSYNTYIFVRLFCCLVPELCLTLRDPMDCSPPGSSVHVISQARRLDWVAISFSKGSSWPRNQICVSWIGKWIIYCWATREVFLFRWYNAKVKYHLHLTGIKVI